MAGTNNVDFHTERASALLARARLLQQAPTKLELACQSLKGACDEMIAGIKRAIDKPLPDEPPSRVIPIKRHMLAVRT